MMKTTHAVEKTARVRQELHPSDYESGCNQRWTIFGRFREFYKVKTAMNSTRREPKIIENKSIGCGLTVQMFRNLPVWSMWC